MKTTLFSNSNIIFSDVQENDTYMKARFCICDFEPNLNDEMINRQTIDNWIDTLIGQPVVGKIGENDAGEADFTSHNENVVIREDINGDEYQTFSFNTSAIGVFTNVSIESIGGKEYIIADAKIWKRFPDVCAVIKKRMAEGTLNTSWEIMVKRSHSQFIDGKVINVIDDGEFLGHCLLAKYVSPAYPNSRLLSVANKCKSDSMTSELTQAIANDVNIMLKDNTIKKSGDISMSKKVVVGDSDGVVPNNISTKKADENTSWSAPTLSDFTDKSWDELSDSDKTKIAEHYAWAKEMPPAKFTDLKLPHHQASDGKVVIKAVENAAARLDQTDIPSGILDKVKSHLAAHYNQFGKKAPWEENKMTDKKQETSETHVKAENKSNTESTFKTNQISKAELTDNDIRGILYQKISESLGISWYDISILAIMPESNTVWVQRFDMPTFNDLDVIIYTYTVKDDDVEISDPTDGKLTVKVSAINDTVAEFNKKISTLNNSLVKANDNIQSLSKTVAELTPYKEAADKAEKTRIAAETEAKRKELKEHAIKSGLIKEAEFESDERVKSAIDNVSLKDLNAVIAERFITSLDGKSKKCTIATSKEHENVESNTKLNLADTDNNTLDAQKIMEAFLGEDK